MDTYKHTNFVQVNDDGTRTLKAEYLMNWNVFLAVIEVPRMWPKLFVDQNFNYFLYLRWSQYEALDWVESLIAPLLRVVDGR